MNASLDPRLHPIRPDLAGAELEGRVAAPRFVEARSAQVARGTVALRCAPSADARLASQIFFGEPVRVYERARGWAWVQSLADGYVGYLEARALGPVRETPSHWVTALRSLVLAAPDEKAPPLDGLPMTAEVCVLRERAGFAEIADGRWVPAAHLAPVRERAADFVAVAHRFLGAPYLWGGKTSLGIDCSGLIQVALAAAGRAAPRDSDMQAARLGDPRPLEEARRRGDLLFMPGHVAIALDETEVLHANAHRMLVAIEPAAEVIARVAAESGRGLTAVKRLT